jgi:hypothetical protein
MCAARSEWSMALLACLAVRAARCRSLLLLLCAALAGVAGARAARADEAELSLHTQLQLGLARFGDPADIRPMTEGAGFLGIGARATYAIHDWYAFEAHLSWGQLTPGPATFTMQDGSTLVRSLSWLRLDGGITARLGVEYVPTIHAAIGVQSRFGGDAFVSYPVWDAPGGDSYVTFDLMSTFGAGFDWRPPGDGDHWVFGGLAMLQRALWTTGPSYDAISMVVHVAYYFYP